MADAADTNYVDSILRGELAAVETYDQVIEKYAGKLDTAALTKIRDTHKSHVAHLQEHVRKGGKEPSTESGTWGTFTGALTGVAKLVGPETALAALKTGEQHGIGQYEKAVENKDLLEETKTTVRTKLLPEARQHVSQLDAMISAHGK